MGLFQPSNRQNFQPPHTHAAGERCPMCEQPIGQDIARRIEKRQREQYEAALAKAKAEAEAATQQKIAAARAEIERAASKSGCVWNINRT